MNEEIKDGGTAFPFHIQGIIKNDIGKYVEKESFNYGMTLRDWFAGMALSRFAHLDSTRYAEQGRKEMAEQAYGIADAMLKEREK